MGVLFGILAATFWGLGDFAIAALTRRVGDARSLAWTQIASLLLWLSMFAAMGGAKFDLQSGLTVLLAAALHVAGLKLTYRAFEVGTLSLVSPLASGFAIVTAVLALIFGNSPAGFALLGAGLLVGGIGLSTTGPLSGPKTLRGVPEAVGSAVAFGGMFYLFDGIVEQVGYVAPLVALKTLATLTFATPHLRSVVSFKDVKVSTVGLVLAVAATDTGAWLAFIYGVRTEYVAVVTAVASLFSVVTVALAGIFLRERLRPVQWAGVVTILFGVLLVSLPK